MIRIEVGRDRAKAIGPFPTKFIMHMSTLSGRKKWEKDSVVFESTAGNIRLLKESEFIIKWIDKENALKEQEEFETDQIEEVNGHLALKAYKPAIKLYDHQNRALALSADQASFAYLLEMGLGKTAIAVANAGYLYLKKEIMAVLILAPKGVHRQWTESEIPLHIDKRIKYKTYTWGDKIENIGNGGSLIFLSMNIDSIRTPRGFHQAFEFMSLYRNKGVMMIVDESHLIKTWNTDRAKAATKLGKLAKFKRILTGTPIAKNIIDAWNQFMFLDERILGHRYITSFRNRYCIMGGWENKQIVGQKNTDEFFRLIHPHSFRRTKSEVLDLPPKNYIMRQYDMGEETKRHYNSLKSTFMTMLTDGEIVDVPNAAVATLRLQQIICGYLPKEDGTLELISNERIDAMMEIMEQIKGQVVIWARFNEDVSRIASVFKKKYGEASYNIFTGATKEKERQVIRDQFQKRKLQYIIGNPQAGGTGNNFQGEDVSMIYYSNSFRALDRWQSEDRIHRMGTKGTVNIFDLVASKSVDRGIIMNLRGKKSISDLTFDEIRLLIAS